MMEKRIQASVLLSFYGPLITQRQRQMLCAYYEEDLSLSEIAELNGMTRQAAHDAIRRGENKLLRMEEKLNLHARWARFCEQLAQCQAHLQKGDVDLASDAIDRILEQEQADALPFDV